MFPPAASSHLATLEWVESGEVGGTDDLRVGGVRGAAAGGRDAVGREALGVGQGVVLPWLEAAPVQRPLQNPVPGARRHGALDDDVGHLVHLERREKVMMINDGQRETTAREAVLLEWQTALTSDFPAP